MPEVLGTDPGPGISGFGTTLQGAIAGVIGNIRKISIDKSEATVLDISTMNNPGRWKTFIAGMKDAKSFTADLVYNDRNTVHVLAALGNANENWTITFPDGSTFVCSGFGSGVNGISAGNDETMMGSLTIKLSGAPTFNSASGS